MSASPALSVKNLTVVYDSSVIIKSASFEIEKGDFVCVVGANGSGKSTLIKAVLRLVPKKSGHVSFWGGQKNSCVGYLPQESAISKVFPATVQEIVLSGMLGSSSCKFFYTKADKARAEDCLSMLKAKHLLKKSFSELSGGQKQKVLLARALVATSDFLILDEPSNNLDYPSRKDFYATLKSLNKSGFTIIMITHDLDVEDLIGNKVLSLENGEISISPTKTFLRRFR